MHICSSSFVFEPRATHRPILRIPFNHVIQMEVHEDRGKKKEKGGASCAVRRA